MKGFGQLALNVHLNVDATFENFFAQTLILINLQSGQ